MTLCAGVEIVGDRASVGVLKPVFKTLPVNRISRVLALDEILHPTDVQRIDWVDLPHGYPIRTRPGGSRARSMRVVVEQRATNTHGMFLDGIDILLGPCLWTKMGDHLGRGAVARVIVGIP